MANIYDRLSKASHKEITDTESYLKDCWPGSNPDWVVSFFGRLVEHASKVNP